MRALILPLLPALVASGLPARAAPEGPVGALAGVIAQEEALALALYAPVNGPVLAPVAAQPQPGPIRRLQAAAADPDDPAMRLLAFIGAAEAPFGYDAHFSAAPRPAKPPTAMTLDEVARWQALAGERRAHRPGGPVSSAIGRYQIIAPTLRALRRQMGLAGTARFDAALQDEMARRLIAEAGWAGFLAGEIPAEIFGTRLARIWAGLPVLAGDGRGRSWYHGFNGNRATVGAAEFEALLAGLRAR